MWKGRRYRIYTEYTQSSTVATLANLNLRNADVTVVDATNQAGIQAAREIFMLIYLAFFVAVKMHWKTLRDTLCNCRWGCDLILSLKPPAAPVRQSTTCCFFSLFLLLAVFCLAAAGWL